MLLEIAKPLNMSGQLFRSPVPQSLTQRLARRLAAPVDAAARARARLHLLDWLGCVAGARASRATWLRGDLAPDLAALLGNVLEMDDIHRTSILHPGPVIWPVLRIADGSMRELLDAAVRGYEATIAIGSTFDARHYAHYHNTATAGVFGAAAAAASLAGLDEARTAWALGHAGSMAGGLWRMRHEACDTKQVHVLVAGETGLTAARMAQSGLAGPAFILEGEQGLYAATCTAPKRMRTGKDWRIAEVSFKPWAACRHAHPAIDAALALRDTADLTGPIRVEAYRDALTFCDRPDPKTVIHAKFSLQHAVAVALVRGTAGLADFEPDAIADPAIAAVRKRVTVAEGAAFTRRYPAHFGAKVSVGKASVSLHDARGDPERPMSEAAIIAKAEALMTWGGVAPKSRRKLIDLALASDDGAPAAKLFGKHFTGLFAA
jgi:2-methylcitrate dehydratase PrpD